MKLQKTATAGGPLIELPEEVLCHILSLLKNRKEIVKTSVLSTQWRFLWHKVPMVLEFHYSKKKLNVKAFICSTQTELLRLKACEKIKSLHFYLYKYSDNHDKDYNFLVEFATQVVHTEEFSLKFAKTSYPGFEYEFPEFAYRNGFLKSLNLYNCQFKDSARFKWINLVKLSIGDVSLTNSMMDKLLIGTPNLKLLELSKVYGLSRLDIKSTKLTTLKITNHNITDPELEEYFYQLQIFAPSIQHLELYGCCRYETRVILRDVTALKSAVISLRVNFNDLEENKKREKETAYWDDVFNSLVHVPNLKFIDNPVLPQVLPH